MWRIYRYSFKVDTCCLKSAKDPYVLCHAQTLTITDSVVVYKLKNVLTHLDPIKARHIPHATHTIALPVYSSHSRIPATTLEHTPP